MGEDNGAGAAQGAEGRDLVSLLFEGGDVAPFSPLLQSGINISARLPSTVEDFLLVQLELSREYVSDRITTIFVDGKATDSLGRTLVMEGSTIALSAAMPGVVGATLRRGSFYAAMRSDITSSDSGDIGGYKEGVICVKLFNLLLNDLGPLFLEKGIFTTAAELTALFTGMPDEHKRRCKRAQINGRDIPPESLYHPETFLSGDTVRLFIHFI
jgi:hypothetical protein